jgi:arylsulfatase A-like enzyme
MQSLAKHKLAQDTLFAYTTDHGGQWPFCKWNLYDGGIHTPLILRWPDKIKPGARTDALISTIDLLPTFIDLAGGSVPDDIDGISFRELLAGQNLQHRDAIYATHTGDGKMNRTPMRCIRTARHKYILNLLPQQKFHTHIDAGADEDGLYYWKSWEKFAQTDARAAQVIHRYHHRPAEELYDLHDDPFERRNLATHPAHQQVLTDLRDRLKQWRIAQGEDLDRVPMPEDARLGPIRYAG